MNVEIQQAKQAESRTRKRDIAAARRGDLDGSAFALAAHCRGLPNSPIRFDAVKLYPLEPGSDEHADDR